MSTLRQKLRENEPNPVMTRRDGSSWRASFFCLRCQWSTFYVDPRECAAIALCEDEAEAHMALHAREDGGEGTPPENDDPTRKRTDGFA